MLYLAGLLSDFGSELAQPHRVHRPKGFRTGTLTTGVITPT